MKLMKILTLFFLLLLPLAVSAQVQNSDVNTVLTAGGEQTLTQGSAPVSEEKAAELPPVWLVIPFALLLGMIATGPLFYAHFWEHHYPKVSFALGAIVAGYYIFILKDFDHVKHSLAEYISFIALLGSLFVASGGILIKVNKKATPLFNTLFLLFGSVIANVIGTTGASMLLIRPFMRINEGRLKAYHIIFFIFTVSNVGGGLTPIGDPPLFLGFLRGVPFFWVIQHVWEIWIPTILIILIVFYLVDKRNTEESSKQLRDGAKTFEFKGLKNVVYLVIILISVFIDPVIMSWVPKLPGGIIGIREIIMFSVMYLAYVRADKEALKGNDFNFHPIQEVAYLFIGIFMTMIPALQLIAHQAGLMGDKLHSTSFYWTTGLFSGILDNAPTYLNFLSAAMGKYGLDINAGPSVVLGFANSHKDYLVAISVGAVFFGALTYIGNGPNFMVKAIAEKSGMKMPSFFEYIWKYSLPLLIPIYLLIWLIFFHFNIIQYF